MAITSRSMSGSNPTLRKVFKTLSALMNETDTRFYSLLIQQRSLRLGKEYFRNDPGQSTGNGIRFTLCPSQTPTRLIQDWNQHQILQLQ